MGINRVENTRDLFMRHSLDTMAETIHTLGLPKWADIWSWDWNHKG